MRTKQLSDDINGFRWIETGFGVFGLEDEPRHFRGFAAGVSDGVWHWYVTGGHAFSISYTHHVGTTYYLCGESPTLQDAKLGVESVVFSIHRYCLCTCFGKHAYATFEIENGEPIVRAVGSARHCEQYLTAGRLIVNVVRYRKRRLATQH